MRPFPGTNIIWFALHRRITVLFHVVIWNRHMFKVWIQEPFRTHNDPRFSPILPSIYALSHPSDSVLMCTFWALQQRQITLIHFKPRSCDPDGRTVCAEERLAKIKQKVTRKKFRNGFDSLLFHYPSLASSTIRCGHQVCIAPARERRGLEGLLWFCTTGAISHHVYGDICCSANWEWN